MINLINEDRIMVTEGLNTTKEPPNGTEPEGTAQKEQKEEEDETLA